MNRRPFTLALTLTCLLLAAFGTASADSRAVAPISLNYPADNAVVSEQPLVSFGWMSVFTATSYKISLRSVDGLQKTTITSGSACVIDHCNYSFAPAEHHWIWREGVTYQWQVKAIDSRGETVAKGQKWSFTTDLRGPLTLSIPSDDQSIDIGSGGTNNVPFGWNRSGYDTFRLLVYKANGDLFHDSGWVSEGATCISNSCAQFVMFKGGPIGQTKAYTWRVLGKRNFVSGKTKSEKRSFTTHAIHD